MHKIEFVELFYLIVPPQPFHISSILSFIPNIISYKPTNENKLFNDFQYFPLDMILNIRVNCSGWVFWFKEEKSRDILPYHINMSKLSIFLNFFILLKI